jgi:Flp pilus assembly protein TadG
MAPQIDRRRRRSGMGAPGQTTHRATGQSLVEFAVVLPMFLILFMGIIDLGLSVFAYNSITNGAREAARLAIVNQDAAKVSARATSQTNVARSATMTVNYYQSNDDGTPDTTRTCPTGAASYVSVGCLAVVRLQGTYQPITPIIGNIVFKNGVTFTATTVLPVEYSCPNASQTAAQCPKQP